MRRPQAPSDLRAPGRKQRAPLTVSRPALLEHGSDDSFRRLVHGLLALAVRHQALRDGHAAVIGLAGPAYTILISILHLDARHGVSVTAIAEHLKVSLPFITAETRRLQARGLVTRRRDPEDGRRVLMSVTPAGLALLSALAPVQRRVNDVEFGGLTADEFQTLLHLVERLVPAAEAALDLQAALRADALRGAA